MNKVNLLVITGLILVSGCASLPTKDIQVKGHADPKANMSGYQTYTWSASTAIINDTYGQWEPQPFDADTEIKVLIDRELRKRGLSERSVDPDVLVSFAAGIDMDARELQLNPKGSLEAMNVPRGGLVLMLIDAHTGYIILKGVATADVQVHPEVETAKARLDYAVTKIFKLLPK